MPSACKPIYCALSHTDCCTRPSDLIGDWVRHEDDRYRSHQSQGAQESLDAQVGLLSSLRALGLQLIKAGNSDTIDIGKACLKTHDVCSNTLINRARLAVADNELRLFAAPTEDKE